MTVSYLLLCYQSIILLILLLDTVIIIDPLKDPLGRHMRVSFNNELCGWSANVNAMQLLITVDVLPINNDVC